VGPRTRLDAVEYRYVSWTFRESKPACPDRSRMLYRLQYTRQVAFLVYTTVQQHYVTGVSNVNVATVLNLLEAEAVTILGRGDTGSGHISAPP
jgi:hypothetical protein